MNRRATLLPLCLCALGCSQSAGTSDASQSDVPRADASLPDTAVTPDVTMPEAATPDAGPPVNITHQCTLTVAPMATGITRTMLSTRPCQVMLSPAGDNWVVTACTTAQVLHADGTAATQPFELVGFKSSVGDSAPVVGDDSGFWALWGEAAPALHLARYALDGSQMGSPSLIDERGGPLPIGLVRSASGFGVAWSNAGFHIQSFDASGNPVGAAHSASDTGEVAHPALSGMVARGGDYVTCYGATDNGSPSVRCISLTADGSTLAEGNLHRLYSAYPCGLAAVGNDLLAVAPGTNGTGALALLAVHNVSPLNATEIPLVTLPGEFSSMWSEDIHTAAIGASADFAGVAVVDMTTVGFALFSASGERRSSMVAFPGSRGGDQPPAIAASADGRFGVAWLGGENAVTFAVASCSSL